MQDVVVYSSSYCPFCQRALALLAKKKVPAKVISVDGKPDVRKVMAEKAGKTSVPQIWIGKTHVGGCDDLYALESQGKLDALLSGQH
ncbi:glutaredoxin 3 [Parendozoicomonas haliclonae]|uniref:Glutaredoxin n=1 Tax=Parendozoicomonas haliclonae TaxID=1960125 RepID=A0A1X7AGA3_9GAMM|nr:glutaredoxin 3 [Parendozoicomonas haliclonae]SMA39332.1 Glutaredoxin-3 [Parendozoicomonas haliclonae]